MFADFLIFAYSAAAVLLASGCLMAAGCAFWRVPSPLWPPQRNRFVAWGGSDVLVAFAAMVLLVPLVFELLLQSSGLFRCLYELTGGNFDFQFGDDKEKLFRHLGLWETFLGFPFKLLLLGVFLHASCDFRPYQLGLSRSRLWQMVVLGWIVWLVCGLPTDLLHFFSSRGYAQLFPNQEEIHSIAKIALEHPQPAEWVILILSAAFIAPCLEELLFRGLLLRWLIARPRGVFITIGVALSLAALTRSAKIESAFQANDLASIVDAFAPLLFAVVVMAGIMTLNWLGLDLNTLNKCRAIFASSLLFAIAHANVWPSPIALFVFAICLGWVASRTQSIIPCIVAHSLFNSVACVELVLGLVREYLPYCSGSA